jgi:hypothetical protein
MNFMILCHYLRSFLESVTNNTMKSFDDKSTVNVHTNCTTFQHYHTERLFISPFKMKLHSHRAWLSVTPCRLTNDFLHTATLLKNTNIIREITASFLWAFLFISYTSVTPWKIQIPFILSGKRIHFI